MNIPIVRRCDNLHEVVATWRRRNFKVAVVPTMGSLHEGHLSFVRAALEKADRVIVTLFVNPKQFNSLDDFAAHPRTEDQDAEKLAPLGAHRLYAPDASQIYPEGFATTVSVSGISESLCGAFRPATSTAWLQSSRSCSCKPAPISPSLVRRTFSSYISSDA